MTSGTTTFRDPDGYCAIRDGRILRFVYPHAADHVRALLRSTHFKDWVARGSVAKTWELPDAEVQPMLASERRSGDVTTRPVLVLEQEKAPFVSYPHEWCPEMLYAAGDLTLELQLQALERGLMLKDATPSNILFWGSRPVFVDILSFVPRPIGIAIWPAYAQFVRTFVLPLLLHCEHGGGTHETFLVRRDGLEPEDVYARLSWAKRLKPSVLKTASIPTWLGKSKAAQSSGPAIVKLIPDDRAKALAQMLINGLQGTLKSVRPVSGRRSTWLNYMETSTYGSEALRVKEVFVRETLAKWSPRTVLDIGGNTGHFSAIAAKIGASVVALDYDPAVVGQAFSHARDGSLDILFLVMSLARPSPAMGWANCENVSFLDRMEGLFDAALLLAVVHHLCVTDGIPLTEIFQILSKLVTKGAVVEFVPPTDPQFCRIIRNKEHLLPRLQQSDFEQALSPWFEIAVRALVPRSGRVLYMLSCRRS